jgi:glutaminase
VEIGRDATLPSARRRLDAKGNSLAGTAALADLSDSTGWSVF